MCEQPVKSDASRRRSRSGNVLLIVPPSATIERPSLGVHVLQACAATTQLNVTVLYANLLFAQMVGQQAYDTLCDGVYEELLCEQFFAEFLYWPKRSGPERNTPASRLAHELKEKVQGWLGECLRLCRRVDYLAVGCSSSFQQNNSSLLLLQNIKKELPHTLTMMGGANCEGVMGRGISRLAKDQVGGAVDVVFSGESDDTFINVLTEYRDTGRRPAPLIVATSQVDIRKSPRPSYHDYFEQLDTLFPGHDRSNIWLPYESSRGCWWATKMQCTFCGTNGQITNYREKAPATVLADLGHLSGESGSMRIMMTDNIMPYSYYKALLPELRGSGKEYQIFYEQKANISRLNVRLLAEAGIKNIQPGIEALSSPLLRLMKKGVSARQNVQLMRFARTYNIELMWNLLCGFPGDSVAWYRDTLRLLPYIQHLSPPSGIHPINIDRFSPYYETAGAYGLRDVTAKEGYRSSYPVGAGLQDLAYHFDATYESESLADPVLIQDIESVVGGWRASWASGRRPTLLAKMQDDGSYVIEDTRAIATARYHEVSPEVAAFAVNGGSKASARLVEACTTKGLVLDYEQEYLPLVVPSLRSTTLFAEGGRLPASAGESSRGAAH